MLLNELTTPFETHRVITYNAAMTKAVYHNIPMRHYAGTLYVGEAKADDYGRKCCMVYAWFEDYKIGIAVHNYAEATELAIIEADAEMAGVMSAAQFISKTAEKIAACAWITLLEIELLQNLKQDLVSDAMDARKIYRERIEERRKANELKRQEEDAAYVKVQNDEAEKIIKKAVETIKDGGILENKELTIYQSGRYDYKNYNIVCYLMDKYGISVPIRTRGWINNSLANITIEKGGSVTNCQYYKRGKSKGSTSVWKYLAQMVKAVREDAKEA